MRMRSWGLSVFGRGCPAFSHGAGGLGFGCLASMLCDESDAIIGASTAPRCAWWGWTRGLRGDRSNTAPPLEATSLVTLPC